MELYLQITQINDFIFCPRSIYFHNVYRNSFNGEVYRETPQKVGQFAHAAIDEKRYSTRAEILQGISVYCEKYNLMGRIDLFNTKTGCLTERKYSITAVYDGFIYQLYAQMFALIETGYSVRSLVLYSSKDHRSYPIPLPTEQDIQKFEAVLRQINAFSLDSAHEVNPMKCRGCNYRELCDRSLAED